MTTHTVRFLQANSQNSVDVEADNTTSVARLKELLISSWVHEELTIDHIGRLIYQGKILADDKYVGDYHLPEDVTNVIHLMLVPPDLLEERLAAKKASHHVKAEEEVTVDVAADGGGEDTSSSVTREAEVRPAVVVEMVDGEPPETTRVEPTTTSTGHGGCCLIL